MAAPVTVAEFKTKFDRNFTYGTGKETVRDADINSAFNDALLIFNSALFDTASGKQAFLYCAAHFLAVNVQAVGGLNINVTDQGINNRSNGVVVSKSVGQVSVTYTEPPERVKKIAALLPFWETEYGKRYLVFLMPKLAGNVGVVSGPIDMGGVIIPIPDAGP